MNVLLIGYRGTGKTTVARHIAERLGWNWLDADVELERRAGKSIAAMFAEDGEQAFRDLESQVLADVVNLEDAIIALGGGVVGREANRDLLRGRPGVVWLQASPETLHARIEADAVTASRRPNLTLHGGLTEIAMLLAKLRSDADCLESFTGADVRGIERRAARPQCCEQEVFCDHLCWEELFHYLRKCGGG